MELFWNWIRQLLCAYCGFWLFLSVLPEHSARNYVRLFGSLILLLLFLEPVLESFGDGEAFGKLVGGFTFRQEAADLTNTMEAAAELGNEAVRNGFEKEAARQAAEEAAAAEAAEQEQESESEDEGNAEYDEDGNEIENVDEDSDYEDESEDDVEYDENGDIVDNAGTSDDVEYDEYGNVIDSDNTVSAEDYESEQSSDSDSSSSSGSGSGSSVVDYATQFVGNPYVWGGTSLTGGADCSGFTQSVYANFGVSLPRTSYEQQNAGTEVSYADAQPGDLICYGGHVAIYMGNGRIVHASNSVDGIKISDNAAYRTIVSVRRLV